MEQLNGLDSLMVLGETDTAPLHIGALFVYDPSTSSSGSLAFADVISLLNKAIDTSLPMLKSHVVKLPFNIDNPYWVTDENFNINSHVERVALPKPANWNALYQMAGSFHSQPLNMVRPLWQAQYVEGLDQVEGVPKGSVALLLKIHHALADGKTAVRIFSALHSLSAEVEAPLILQQDDDYKERYVGPGRIRSFSRAYWHTLTSPIKFMTNLTELAPKLISSPVRSRPSTSISKTVFNTMPSAQRLIRHLKIPMSEILLLETLSGSTINDIALCIVSGALRDYLQSHAVLPDESLHAIIPVDIRMDDKLSSIGNQLSFINLNLSSDVSDARQRLATIHQAALEGKEETARVGRQSFMSLINYMYSGVLAWAGKKVVESKYVDNMPLLTNTIITNVPGVPVPCYLCGAKLIDYVGFGPLVPTVSLFHVISSVDSHVNISFQTCSDDVVDTNAYVLALEDSYKELLVAFDVVGGDK